MDDVGCHVLALDLVRSWTFDRPSMQSPPAAPALDEVTTPPSPTISRRPTFTLGPAMRRRSSIVIDMDIPSLPPTRSASPVRVTQIPTIAEEPGNEEGDLIARRAGLGNLMKTAKQDVKVPEFDMNAFF